MLLLSMVMSFICILLRTKSHSHLACPFAKLRRLSFLACIKHASSLVPCTLAKILRNISDGFTCGVIACCHCASSHFYSCYSHAYYHIYRKHKIFQKKSKKFPKYLQYALPYDIIKMLGGFPSGQRGRTVTPLDYLSKVQILLRPSPL